MNNLDFLEDKNLLVISRPGLTFFYDMASGLFSAERSSGTAFSSAESIAEFSVGGKRQTISSSSEQARSHTISELPDGLLLRVTRESGGRPALTQEFLFFDEKEYFYIRAGIENPPGAEKIELITIRPLHIDGEDGLRLGPSPMQWSVYNLGFQSWTPAGAVPIAARQERPSFIVPQTMVYNPLRYPPRTRGKHLCDWMAAVKNLETSESLVCGFVTMKDMLSHIYIGVDIHRRRLIRFSAQCGADHILLAPGAAMNSEWCFVLFTGDPITGMEAWADAAGAEMNARVPAEIPVGWCSWYKYFTDITQKDMLSNLEGLETLSRDIPVKFFQIDDGYQKAVGDWLTLRDERFPGGMKMLADKSRERGFEPGIWVAPFFARKNSRLFMEHRDWFIRDEKGGISFAGFNPLWGGPLAALDLTIPQVQDWLRETFRVIVHEWGYKYLKLDFLYSAVVRGTYRDRSVTRAQAYRRGLEIIRETAGADAFILGCGAPLGPSVGIVDAMRIGTDIGPKWRDSLTRALLGSRSDPSAESSLINCVTRSFLHGRLWANDPDCILLRKGNFTRDEYFTMATIIGLTGGMLLISDNLLELDEEGRRVFSTLVPPAGVHAVAADMFENPAPSMFSMAFPGLENSRLAACINWKDHAHKLQADFAALGLDPDAEYHVFSHWDEKYLGALSGGVAFRNVPAHGCRLLSITPAGGVPAAVGSNLHITSGRIEIKEQRYDAESNTLSVSLALPGKRGGKLFISVPDEIFPESVKNTGGGTAELASHDKRICAVEVGFRDSMEFKVAFGKNA